MRIEPEYFSERPYADTLSLLLADIHMVGGSYVFSEWAAPWSFKMHTPHFACFYIVLSGNAWLKILPHGEILQLKVGELIIFPQGIEHIVFCGKEPNNATFLKDFMYETSQEHTRFFKFDGRGKVTQLLCGYFQFDMSLAQPLISALPMFLHLPSDDGNMHEWLKIGIHFIVEEAKRERPAHQAILNRIFDLLFIECMREYIENLPVDNNNWLRALRDPYLSRTLTAIHRQPANLWTLELLAKESGLSRSALASRFSLILGQGVMEYLTAYRMRLVAWWLHSSSLTLAHIAEKVGYSSEAALSQAFKRKMGCSPRHYRITSNDLDNTLDVPF